ncbi:VanZ family protein [Streptomyces marispadix]|uniref:VanZ family protein n=1 Tax=Streptomyces marispadix TaxID=2922868 RepID=A0ABS9SYF0_9ACTN|nr:VanZ family protein [Streptomyces marispadix]MCH6161309.1 VanZ family protein [Streptomyces marispadix]
MTYTYLLPIKTAAALFPLLALLLLLPTAVALYRRHGVMTSGRFLSLFAFVHYLLTAACMTVVPLPGEAVDVCARYAQMAAPQLMPGNTFGDIWKEAHHRTGLGPLLIHNPAVAGAAFNLLLLLPLGVFLRYHFRRGLRGTACAGFALSLTFELTQWTGVWGLYDCPYRLFDVDDLAINTSGAVLGWALTGPVARLLPALDALDGKALSRVPVPLGRRLTALLVDLIGVSLTTPFCLLVVAYGGGADDSGTLLAVPLAVCAVWFVVLPYATGGATPGKRLLRLRLVTDHAGPGVVWRLTLRAALLGGVLLPLFSLLLLAALTLAEHPSPLALSPSAWPGDLADAAARAEAYSREIAAAAAAAGLSVLLPLTLLRRPGGPGLGLHERLSGVRNAALPPTAGAAVSGDRPVQPDGVVWRERAAGGAQVGDVRRQFTWSGVTAGTGGTGMGVRAPRSGAYGIRSFVRQLDELRRLVRQVREARHPHRSVRVHRPRHARPRSSFTLSVPPTPPGGPRPWRRTPRDTATAAATAEPVKQPPEQFRKGPVKEPV